MPSNIKFNRIFSNDEINLQTLSKLATSIVREHYDKIIGTAQNDYMLKKFQSVSAIKQQIENGYTYYMLTQDETPVAFTAFYERDDKIYISKLYVKKEYRGQNLSRKMLDFISNEAKNKSLKGLFLNVNRYNSQSIAIYEHLGFSKIKEEKIDIGNGYYMDDFVMQMLF